MKILQIGKFFPIRGGIEKVMYDLMLGLSARGIHCDMLCASTENHPAGETQLNPYAKLIIVPTKVKLAATMLAPSMILKLRSIAKKYDIVHIHHPDPMAALALYLSGYKGKVVLHWHSDILKQKRLLQVYKPIQSWLIKRAELVVGTTPVYVENSQYLQHVKEKIDYIPIGIESFDKEESIVKRLLEVNKGKFLVFSLGRLVEYKGYEYLIKSAQYLDENHKIIIGGKGPLYESLNRLIQQLNLQDRVELIGYLSDEEAYAYFEACDTFVMSSVQKTEAFGIVQIEAMSCAKPLISTDIDGSGVSWVNLDGVSGLVVPICDDQALAHAIKELSVHSESYQRLAQGSKLRYEEFFTRDVMVAKCLHLYNKVLSDKLTVVDLFDN